MAKKRENNPRHEEILHILRETTYTTVQHLSQKLHISPSSIRRDLSELEAHGAVLRSYGGVSLVVPNHRDLPFGMRMESRAAQKKLIAAKAQKLVRDGDTVFVDASSTCMYLIHELADKRGITVITNSVNGIHYLQSFRCRVVCTGGYFDPEDRAAMVGSETIRRVSEMRANAAFFSPQALDAAGVMFDCYPEEIAVVRQMLAGAAQKICLCDSSKFGKNSSFREADLSDMDVLVSDTLPDAAFRERFPQVRFL